MILSPPHSSLARTSFIAVIASSRQLCGEPIFRRSNPKTDYLGTIVSNNSINQTELVINNLILVINLKSSSCNVIVVGKRITATETNKRIC